MWIIFFIIALVSILMLVFFLSVELNTMEKDLKALIGELKKYYDIS